MLYEDGASAYLGKSTRCGIRCSAVDEYAHPHQAPLKLHVETWAGLLRNQGLQFSQEKEIVPECAVAVACPSCLDNSPELPGPGRVIWMKPRCAEGEVTTAANLNLFRGWRSCVDWHRDVESLFGKCGEAKLIVSVLAALQSANGKGQSCPDDEARLCCLGHGDILVMDGQCQDEFLHRKDPGREQERINVTFRWVKQHVSSCPSFKVGVACCLPTCAQGLSVPVMGISGNGVFLGFLASLLSCVLGRCQFC